jgi:hypothetical protein
MAGLADLPTLFRRALPLSLALLALGLLLLVLEISRPCYFLHDDNATWFAGAYLHDYRVLAETGRLAVVNYYQYGGEPFLEQGQTAVLYPPVYLGEFLAKIVPGDPRWALEWIAAMHLLLGLAGFYFWLRQNGVTPAFAAIGGLAWVLNPFVMIIASSWIMVTYVAAWLPWLFWAFDRLLARPSLLPATLLGTFLGLFFLQGYVQWTVYAVLFLGFYAAYQFYSQREFLSLRLFGNLLFAVLVFLVLALPLLLPMLHAMDVSAARSHMVEMGVMLFYKVEAAQLWPAQIGQFSPYMFGVSSAIFFCPALVLIPLAVVRFWQCDAEERRPLFVFLLLALLALIFTGRCYVLLTVLPLLDKFRWPFKIFVYAEFFLLTALLGSLSSWTTDIFRKSRGVTVAAMACAIFVLAAETTVSLSQHDGNFFSKTMLPTSQPALPRGMDSTLGRVIAIGDHLPELASDRFFTHCYGTFYEVPSLGGYNPLVGREQLNFALGLDFPNMYFLQQPFTEKTREEFEARSVRYWIVDPHAMFLPDFGKFDGLKLLAMEPDRVIYEDTRALPIAYSIADPGTPCPLIYSGNSILVSLDRATSPVKISVGPTDGWWYRLDRGAWRNASYRDDGLISFPPGSRLLEITYFDRRFELGLLISGSLTALLLLVAGGLVWRSRG